MSNKKIKVMENKTQNRKSLKRRMNRTAILQFYKAREFYGDVERIAERTGYSKSHISNVIAGRRRITDEIANVMYYISYRRKKNSEVLN
jgi:ribosomal protein S21